MNRECRLTDRLVVTAKPDTHEYSVRDTGCKGLALRVQPTGARTWILRGLAADPRQRHSLGDAGSLTVADARRIAHAILSGSPPAVRPTSPACSHLQKVRPDLSRSAGSALEAIDHVDSPDVPSEHAPAGLRPPATW